VKETRNAIADRLLANGDVTSQIGTYFSVPSIFSLEPVPSAVQGRYIVVRAAHVDVETLPTKTPYNPPADMIITRAREVHHDIAVFEDQTGDSSDLENLSRIIRDAFHRQSASIAVSGYGVLIAKATGPVATSESEEMVNQVDGRVVTVELTVIRA